jgi:hypothetical protein
MDAESFLAGYPSSTEAHPVLLGDPAFRSSLYRLWHPAPSLEFLPLVRDMFQREAGYRADASNDGEYYENIYWNALFLYQIGDFDDVTPMWKAKHINMDTGFGFDIQFLVGRGVAETIEYLQRHGDQSSDEIGDYLTKCRDAGDFDDLDEWLRDRIEYFG